MFLKNKNGSSETISFIFILPILLFTVFAFMSPIFAMYDYFTLISVRNQALNRMEVEGGLTPEIEEFIIDTLTNRGLDENKIRVVSNSRGTFDYGSELDLKIEYDYDYNSYNFAGVAIIRDTQEKTMSTEGKTISLTFEQDT